MLMHLSHRFISTQFQLRKILSVAVLSTVGLHVERRRHLQSVCLQDVVLVDQTDENRLELSLGCQVDAAALTNQTFTYPRTYVVLSKLIIVCQNQLSIEVSWN
ncbi:hypothetical protein AVEN_187725-1 [Araneus ventricosus]|uniref:Uncharacterized protein n=1 Tax=Araneus ventricosus TaxID=182803 RepID=A0A4Y2C434_ARAVE|nr:hypothetical protein AVEN_187725-1 [Araneus ventricosus]